MAQDPQNATLQQQDLYDFLQGLMLILHRRPAGEHDELISLVERHTSDKEVSTMAQTMAEVLLERGARETTMENMVAVLTARFPQADINALKPTLEAIADLNRLKHLNLNASLAPSFQAFQRELEA